MHDFFLDTIKYANVPKFHSFTEFLQQGFSLNKEDRFSDFRLEFAPWLATVAEWIDSADVEWVYLLQGSQTGKTTIQMAFLLYVSQKEPCRLVWVQSTEEEAKQFITERLKPYIDGYDSEAIAKKNWKTESFRVYQAKVKVGYASNEQTMRSVPAQYLVGDECAVWKYPVALLKKRSRTYAGRRKGIFATTPPRNGDHHSWLEAKEADFYQWWVSCPHCGEYQALTMAGLKWEGKTGDAWDFAKVSESAHYVCRACKGKIYEQSKLALINSGKAVCVDPTNDFQPTEPRRTGERTLQVSSLYSIFTTWGELATQFIKAKHSGADALKIFITDELAEVPREQTEKSDSIKVNTLSKFIDEDRASGFVEGYRLYTVGVDVQRAGELYVVVVGWKAGEIPSGHVLIADIVKWDLNGNFKTKWSDLLCFFSDFDRHLARVAIDATDGLVAQEIFDFCNSVGGNRYIALKDSTWLHTKTQIKNISPESYGKKTGAQQWILVANSDMVKDDIAAAFLRPAKEMGAWSFPADISPAFLKAMTMEQRTTDKNGKSSWKPVYSHAPNHYFSALVYASAAMEQWRAYLQKSEAQINQQQPQRQRLVSRGIADPNHPFWQRAR